MTCTGARFCRHDSDVDRVGLGKTTALITLTIIIIISVVTTVITFFSIVKQGGDVAQLVDHRTGTLPTQVRFPGATRDFSPGVNFQCRLSYGVRTPPCAIACICAQVKDPVVHVRVRLIMVTLKKKVVVVFLNQHAQKVGQRDSVAAGFPRGKQPQFPMGKISVRQYSCRKKEEKKSIN